MLNIVDSLFLGAELVCFSSFIPLDHFFSLMYKEKNISLNNIILYKLEISYYIKKICEQLKRIYKWLKEVFPKSKE